MFTSLSVASKLSTNTVNLNQVNETASIRISLPYKQQRAADTVRKQMRDLSNKIGLSIHPVCISRKLEQDLKFKETKPSIVNKQCVVYLFKCSLCDADYVGYTTRHLHQRIAEHKFSAIRKHLSDSHGDKNLLDESQFCVLRKCQGKFDCLINEMLFIKKLAPSLNTQSDSIRAKLFV
jgi:hypothetical protein